VWFFITADISLFAVLFAAFMFHRAGAPALFEQSRQALNPTLGTLNTLILLTSSWLVALAVEAARAAERARVVRLLCAGMLVGGGFAVTKAVEYAAKIEAGLTMVHDDFYMFYWSLTGLHFVHFLLGMVVLGVCLHKARHEALDARYVVWIESSGCYWHMVDLLWIMIFPMIYLLRAA
jgi:nitric oxide reductase NorE protein